MISIKDAHDCFETALSDSAMNSDHNTDISETELIERFRHQILERTNGSLLTDNESVTDKGAVVTE